jgi:SAM-dependent methyltransferase
LLEQLANDGPVLELGIGTGRIALPLQARGLTVSGIDASPAMIAKLRAKDGGDQLTVIEGDFRTVGEAGEFELIFVASNTLFALLTQEAQLDCFRNAANRLTDSGCFLVEAFVPDLSRFDRHQRVVVVSIGDEVVRLDATTVDPANQQVTTQHTFLSDEGVKLFPVKLRYSWPSELDLMARLAGLHLAARWADWDKRPFDKDSQRHISVYRLASEASEA